MGGSFKILSENLSEGVCGIERDSRRIQLFWTILKQAPSPLGGGMIKTGSVQTLHDYRTAEEI